MVKGKGCGRQMLDDSHGDSRWSSCDHLFLGLAFSTFGQLAVGNGLGRVDRGSFGGHGEHFAAELARPPPLRVTMLPVFSLTRGNDKKPASLARFLLYGKKR